MKDAFETNITLNSKTILSATSLAFKFRSSDQNNLNTFIEELGIKQNKPTLLKYESNHELSCYLTSIHENAGLVQEIRTYIKKVYKKSGYKGFDDFHDFMLDFDALYFFVRDRNHHIQAVSRFIHKTLSNYLPFELGVVVDKQFRYVATELNSVDINSFCFTSLRAVNLMFRCGIRYLFEKKFSKIYCLCDTQSKTIERFYKRMGWSFSEEFQFPIYFPSYGQSHEQLFFPASWRIMEARLSDISSVNSFL